MTTLLGKPVRIVVLLAFLLLYSSVWAQNPAAGPNFNYKVLAPDGWLQKDTAIGNLKLRFIRGPIANESDHPFVNVLINFMDGRAIAEFAWANERYLATSTAGISKLTRGRLAGSPYNIYWITYTKEQQGVRRDMINYMIPVRGFAYMMTCGVREGTMKRYRKIFDKMAKTFRA